MIHDRRQQRGASERLADARYRALWQSDHWATLLGLVDKLALQWQVDMQTTETLDAYTIASLLRDGRIQGMRFLLGEIQRLANEE